MTPIEKSALSSPQMKFIMHAASLRYHDTFQQLRVKP